MCRISSPAASPSFLRKYSVLQHCAGYSYLRRSRLTTLYVLPARTGRPRFPFRESWSPQFDLQARIGGRDLADRGFALGYSQACQSPNKAQSAFLCRQLHGAENPPTCRAESEWRGWESNPRHHDFQSCALPTELPRLGRAARGCARGRLATGGRVGLLGLAGGLGSCRNRARRARPRGRRRLLRRELGRPARTRVASPGSFRRSWQVGAESPLGPTGPAPEIGYERRNCGTGVGWLGRGASGPRRRAGRGRCTGARCWCSGRW